MRLIFKVGLVPDNTPLSITAASEPDTAPRGHWFSRQISLEALAGILGVAITLYGYHLDANHRLQEESNQQAQLATQVDANSKKLENLSTKRLPDLVAELHHDTVSRAQYEHDTVQLNLTLTQLETGQQQIYNLLVERRGR